VVLLAACGDDDEKLVDDTDVPPVETEDTDVDDTAYDTYTELPDTDLTRWPDDPEDYVFDGTTYLSRLGLPGLDGQGEPTCCRDWGRRSRDAGLDNAVARFVSQLSGVVDLQAELDLQLQYGNFAVLLEHHGIPSGDGTYDLAMFLGEFGSGTDWTAASTGHGDFDVWSSSFVGSTGAPATVFQHVSVTSDRLEADGGDVDIPIPFVGSPLVVPAHDVTLTGKLDRTPFGVSLEDGELSGYVKLDEFYQAYNQLADRACGCAGLTGPLFARTPDGWEAHCPSSDDVIEHCGAYTVCAYLLGDDLFARSPGYCAMIAPLVPTLADIDLDRDPSTFEAFSLGLEVTGVPAEVVGIVPPPF
jgi:hypothetical protein